VGCRLPWAGRGSRRQREKHGALLLRLAPFF
jgi:hypothetical protein